MRTHAIVAAIVGTLGCASAGTLIAVDGPANTTALAGGGIRVDVPLDSVDGLRAIGLHEWSGGIRSRFTSEGLELHAKGYEEWMGYDETDWVRHVNSAHWAIEARFRVDRGCDKIGTGFWIHDRRSLVRVYVSRDTIGLADSKVRVPIGPTDRMRSYRIELANEKLSLYVDGDLVYRGAVNRGAEGTVSLSIGHGGSGCGDEISTWAHLAYELYPRASELEVAR